MVIAKGRSGIAAIAILADGEFLPENFNSPKTLVFRQGESTGRQLKIVKPFGELAGPELLCPKSNPICNYEHTEGDPLHQHKDESWWFYDADWQLEQGPFDTYDEAFTALGQYCIELQAAKECLTKILNCDTVLEDEQTRPTEPPEPDSANRD